MSIGYKLLIIIFLTVVFLSGKLGLGRVFAQQDCYYSVAGETPLPTFGPTCAVEPSPQPTSPPQPTATSPPKGGPLPTSPPTPTMPVSGHTAATSAVFFGGILFLLLGFSIALGLSPRLLYRR